MAGVRAALCAGAFLFPLCVCVLTRMCEKAINYVLEQGAINVSLLLLNRDSVKSISKHTSQMYHRLRCLKSALVMFYQLIHDDRQ